MYLFDTNVLVEIVSRRPRAGLLRRFADLKTGQFNTSAIVIMELRQGTARDRNPAAAWDAIERVLLHNLTVLDFTERIALAAADIDAALERRGRTLPEIDLMIGVTAVAHSLKLVTRNVKDFMDIPGLEIENWVD